VRDLINIVAWEGARVVANKRAQNGKTYWYYMQSL